VVVNYPNPFGNQYQTTKIDYYLSQDADVAIKIFDLFGNLVWTKEIAAGNEGAKGRQNSQHPNSVEWSGVNDNGQPVGNGGYLLLAKANADGKNIMNYKRKIVVLR
jgi:flagellar hook assembly protein FlgD